jgi:hypothetical protein
VVRTGRAAAAADAPGKAVVVISSTVRPNDVGTRFRGSIAPIVTWEAQLFDDLGLTGSAGGNGMARQSRITIMTPAHPLAAGLSGLINVTTAPTALAWGKPSASAARIARLPGNASRFTIFGYERGAAMVGLTAPARRVGLFLGDTAATILTPDGAALFDAAIRWASGG